MSRITIRLYKVTVSPTSGNNDKVRDMDSQDYFDCHEGCLYVAAESLAELHTQLGGIQAERIDRVGLLIQEEKPK